MEYCFIQVADAGDLTVPHSIEPLVHFFECMVPYLFNVIRMLASKRSIVSGLSA